MWNSKEFGISSNNYWKEKHHIVFRGQGGLDLEYNLIELDADFHKGKDGPHLNRQTDLKLKRNVPVGKRFRQEQFWGKNLYLGENLEKEYEKNNEETD